MKTYDKRRKCYEGIEFYYNNLNGAFKLRDNNMEIGLTLKSINLVLIKTD